MRKTIGTNPLDAVVPNLVTGGTTNGTAKNKINSGVSTSGPPPRAAKERLTVHISVPLIERAKNAVFWTPGLTLADLGEQALETLVAKLEQKNGGQFETRPHELKGGRPLK